MSKGKLSKLFAAWAYAEAAFVGVLIGHASNRSKEAPKPRARLPKPKTRARFQRLSTRAAASLQPGITYAAELDIPFFVAPLVSESALVEGLKKEGFRPILVRAEMPLGWPGASGADWYILTEYAGQPKTENVPGAVRALWKRG